MSHLEKPGVAAYGKIESAAIGCDITFPRTAVQSQLYRRTRRAGQGLTVLPESAIEIVDGVHQTDAITTTASELELLRTTLSLDQTLFTVQRHTSRPKGSIRVECFASKGADSPGLTRITKLVAGVFKYRRNPRGLTMANKEDIGHLVVALSRKLDLDLKHERLN